MDIKSLERHLPSLWKLLNLNIEGLAIKILPICQINIHHGLLLHIAIPQKAWRRDPLVL